MPGSTVLHLWTALYEINSQENSDAWNLCTKFVTSALNGASLNYEAIFWAYPLAIQKLTKYRKCHFYFDKKIIYLKSTFYLNINDMGRPCPKIITYSQNWESILQWEINLIVCHFQ